MTRAIVGLAVVLSALLVAGLPAYAQTTPAAPAQSSQSAQPAENDARPPIPFEGGEFAISVTSDGDKILAFDGRELARNYLVFFDRMVELGETKVALFSVGDGGNQCGPSTVIVWRPKGQEAMTQTVGEECGAPPVAATTDSIYFVPNPVPGSAELVRVWSPDRGLRVAGNLFFAPQPGTGWRDLDFAAMNNVVEAFNNEAVYQAGRKLLREELTGFATGLLTGGGVETTASGVSYASGCVPHACGSADSFMAVDPGGRKVYFAQTGSGTEPKTWPALKAWPGDVRAAMQAALGPQQ